MEFGFDESESASNEEKHGIGFVDAQTLWDDPNALEIPARTGDEPRFLIFGKIGEKHWTGVFTYRDEVVRIISVRRSRRKEIMVYES
jgi:uncharacterized protein